MHVKIVSTALQVVANPKRVCFTGVVITTLVDSEPVGQVQMKEFWYQAELHRRLGWRSHDIILWEDGEIVADTRKASNRRTSPRQDFLVVMCSEFIRQAIGEKTKEATRPSELIDGWRQFVFT